MSSSIWRATVSLAGGLISAALLIAPASAQALPNWLPRDICANDSASGQCLLFEQRAKNDVTASWGVLPEVARQTCLIRFKPPLEPSWRILGDCLEVEGRRAQQTRIDTQRKREEEALAQLESRRSNAPAEQSTSKPVAATPATSPETDDQKRVDEEEASFMALLAEQRKADEQAQAAKSAAQAARTAEAERKRVAAEESSFMALLAEQQRAEAKRQEQEERARAAADVKQSEAEQKRVAQEEASFMALLEAQRRADAEAAQLKADAAKAAREQAARSCEARLEQVQSSGVIQFAFNSAALAGDTDTTLLDKLASAASECEGKLSIRVEGHTDSRGSASANQRLSQARAETVAEYLQSKGVAKDRISAKGFGSAKPIASNQTSAGRAKNRRIEFKVY